MLASLLKEAFFYSFCYIARNMSATHKDLALKAVSIMVNEAIKQTPEEGMWILADDESPLSRVIASAYREVFPWAVYRAWDAEQPDLIKEEIRALKPGTLVVLVQSTNFRLDAFRIRMEIFARNLKTIEHVHLARMSDVDEQTCYLNGICVRPQYFTTQAKAMTEAIANAEWMEIESGEGKILRWDSAFEPAKLNIGDYAGMKSIGGTFPIGEVFTEAKEVFKGSGEVVVYAFANQQFQMEFFEPFAAQVVDGIIQVRGHEPEVFRQTMELVAASERAIIREIGFGLNPAFGKHAFVSDVTAFERQRGLHLSIGEKHSVYHPKPDLKKRDHARYHVDVFIDVKKVTTSKETLFENGDWIV